MRTQQGLAVTAVSLQLAACAAAFGFPPEAMRKSPPAGIENRALAVGAPFPRLTVRSTAGDVRFTSGTRYALVFYRGDW